jgi:hypothetical protein
VKLGLKQEKDFDVKLAELTPEALSKLHQTHSFTIGGAMMGVFINGFLTCVFPSSAVGATLNLRQLVVAYRSRRKIEEASEENYGRDLRNGPDRAPKKRHLFAGGSFKLALSIMFLGQNDFVEAAKVLAHMDLASPATVSEVVTGGLSDMFFHSSGVEDLHNLADHLGPANKVTEFFGFEHNPTWDQMFQGGSTEFVAVAATGIGAAAEVNLASLGIEAAGEGLHKNTLPKDKQGGRKQGGRK